MSLSPDVYGLLLISGGLLITVVLAIRRASRDWPYQLRVMRVFALLACLDAPGDSLDVWEVVLIEPYLCEGSFTVAFSMVNRPQDVGLLYLDIPLGELTEQCVTWREADIPLLYSRNALGEVVLHGPDGWLVGRVTWLEPAQTDSRGSW